MAWHIRRLGASFNADGDEQFSTLREQVLPPDSGVPMQMSGRPSRDVLMATTWYATACRAPVLLPQHCLNRLGSNIGIVRMNKAYYYILNNTVLKLVLPQC